MKKEFNYNECANCGKPHKWGNEAFLKANTPQERIKVCMCSECLKEVNTKGIEFGAISVWVALWAEGKDV